MRTHYVISGVMGVLASGNGTRITQDFELDVVMWQLSKTKQFYISGNLTNN